MNTVPFVQMTFETLALHSARLALFLQAEAWQYRKQGNEVMFASMTDEATVINNQSRYLMSLHQQGVTQLPVNTPPTTKGVNPGCCLKCGIETTVTTNGRCNNCYYNNGKR